MLFTRELGCRPAALLPAIAPCCTGHLLLSLRSGKAVCLTGSLSASGGRSSRDLHSFSLCLDYPSL